MSADEFEIIRTLFAPLAAREVARGLLDDVAVLRAQGALVVTTDAIVEGVHFRADDPIETIAKKALRVNVSDLAAKGAKPVGALLILIWPNDRSAAQIAAFARGLGEDLQHFSVPLLGGDTTSTPGPLTISMTLFGEPLGPRVPSRADAKAGQDIWVTGSLGDAWLGHEVLAGKWKSAHDAFVVGRYRVPEPRLELAPVVARYAAAAMDVSDGLAADAGKLAAASGVRLAIEVDALPLSEAARAWRAERSGYGRLFTWGDDYEILFTADAGDRRAIETAVASLGVQAKRIGAVEAGEGVAMRGADGVVLSFETAGHSHQLGD